MNVPHHFIGHHLKPQRVFCVIGNTKCVPKFYMFTTIYKIYTSKCIRQRTKISYVFNGENLTFHTLTKSTCSRTLN